jgi:hypothetical protein
MEQAAESFRFRDTFGQIFKAVVTGREHEALTQRSCLLVNAYVGGFLLLGALLATGITLFAESAVTPLSAVAGQMVGGGLLAFGYPLSRRRPDLASRVLVVQGTLLLILVSAYAMSMVAAAHEFEKPRGTRRFGRMSHPLGLLAVVTGYGLWLILQNSDRGSALRPALKRNLPRLAFAFGLALDGFIVYSMFASFLKR